MSQATHLVIPGVLMDDPMSIFWMAFDDVKVGFPTWDPLLKIPGGWILQSHGPTGIPVANEGFKLQFGWGGFLLTWVGRKSNL